jgi:hypothetical protein
MYTDKFIYEILKKHLINLVLTFLGPQVPKGPWDMNPTNELEDLCSVCRKTCRIQYQMVRGLYHEVIREPPYSPNSSISFSGVHPISPPDIVIAANCGLHEKAHPLVTSEDLYESWRPTSQLLGRMNVPVVYTSYNSAEGLKDQEALSSWGINIISSCKVNPWRGLRPFPDEIISNSFYYNNYYCIVTKGLHDSS